MKKTWTLVAFALAFTAGVHADCLTDAQAAEMADQYLAKATSTYQGLPGAAPVSVVFK